MNSHTAQLMYAREAGRQGWPCPVEKGDKSDEALAIFHAWLVAATVEETGAVIIPEYAGEQHRDLQICRREGRVL